VVAAQSLGYLDLLNAFEFTWDVYAAFFCIMGIIIVLIGAVVWGVNRVLTKLRHPPKFRFWSLFTIVAPAPFKGSLLAATPFWIGLGLMWIWFYTLKSSRPDISPSKLSLEHINPSYSFGLLFEAAIPVDDILLAKRGRFGTTLFIMGMLLLFEISRALIPESLDKHYEDDITQESDAFEEVRASGAPQS
jgi:hypothetical protein